MFLTIHLLFFVNSQVIYNKKRGKTKSTTQWFINRNRKKLILKITLSRMFYDILMRVIY